MPQALLTGQHGLFTSPNPFGGSPQGALAVADNCVIKDHGILESRRGLPIHSALASGSILGSFSGSPVAVAGTGSNNVQYYNGSAWTNLGTVTAPSSGVPNRIFTVQKNLYVTSGTGLQATTGLTSALFAAGPPTPKPPTSVTFINHGTLTPGGIALPQNCTVNYCLVLYDKRLNLRSVPSSPVAYTNPISTNLSYLDVTVDTSGLDSNHVLELYRTQNSGANTAPGSDYFLVAIFPTAAGSVTIIEDRMASELGPALYTNTSVESLGEENDPPPVSNDVCQYKGYTLFGGIVDDRQHMTLQLSAANSAHGWLGGDILRFDWSGGSWTVTANYVGTTANINVINQLQAMVIAAAQYAPLNAVASLRAVGTSLLVTGTTLGGGAITASFLSTEYTIIAGGFVRTTGSPNVVTVGQANHPWVVGCFVTVEAGDANFPAGTYMVDSIPDANHWTYRQNGTLASSSSVIKCYHANPGDAWIDGTTGNIASEVGTAPAFSPVGQVYGAGVITSSTGADVADFRVSKTNQPGACPLQDSFTVGTNGVAIRRIIPLQGSALIFKDAPDGIYKLTGSSPNPSSGDPFVIQPYDLNTYIAAPETAVALGDSVLMLSTKGPVAVSESAGILPLAPAGMDCPVREALLTLLATVPNTATKSFAVAYESEKQYWLWTPTLASDTQATQAWVFNAPQTAWTRAPFNATSAFINPATNALMLVDGTNVRQESKTGTATDYADGTFSATVSNVISTTQVRLTGNPAGVGDLITQGGSSAWVLSVDTTSSPYTLTLNKAVSWTTGAATYSKAISCGVTYLPWAGGEQNPGATHFFSELVFNFRSLAAPFVFATYATDVDPNTEQLLCYGAPTKPGNVNIRAGIGRNKGRGVMLSAGFIHQAAQCNFQLQSTSLLFRPVSGRTPSHGSAG